MAGEECKKSWVCPSNRELLLRGRLNYGWSFNTNNAFRKVKIIPSEELEIIENVLNRAREAEQAEVNRVGRLLCRLENISRNAVGDGRTSCFMCGVRSGRFKNAISRCLDCARVVCEKCSVDYDAYILCIICWENREVWKKSGGWFYGRFPTMGERSQEECTAVLSGSPGAFNKWEHRAPDIVRLESFEPPEENHNDHSLYKDWSVSSTFDQTLEINQDETQENENLEEISSTKPHNFQDLNSADDVTDNEENGIFDKTSYLELTPIGKANTELELNDTKISASCPSLPDLKDGPKLKRKLSVRRKQMPNSTRKMLRKFSNLLHPE